MPNEKSLQPHVHQGYQSNKIGIILSTPPCNHIQSCQRLTGPSQQHRNAVNFVIPDPIYYIQYFQSIFHPNRTHPIPSQTSHSLIRSNTNPLHNNPLTLPILQLLRLRRLNRQPNFNLPSITKMQMPIITNDYPLNRIAETQGVTVLNVNSLSNAVRSIFLPGDTLPIRIIQEGREPDQGVGYLEDGTMVVVEQGRAYIGQDVHITVTSVLQTPAGRMIFGRIEPRSAAGGPPT